MNPLQAAYLQGVQDGLRGAIATICDATCTSEATRDELEFAVRSIDPQALLREWIAQVEARIKELKAKP